MEHSLCGGWNCQVPLSISHWFGFKHQEEFQGLVFHFQPSKSNKIQVGERSEVNFPGDETATMPQPSFSL